jgi:fibronectin-binding autotransporter adhesin
LTLSPSARAQSVCTGGDNNNQWTDPLNWNPGVPVSGVTGLFNTAGNGQTAISLGGATQTVGAIQFDTASAVAYTLGVTPGDTFSITNNNISAGVGAISLTNTVTTPQAINASISFNGLTPLITNAAATTLTLGAPGGSSTISNANATPTSLTLTMSTGATIVVNDAITGSVGGTPTTGGLILTEATTSGSSTILFNNGRSTYTGITNLNNTTGAITLQIGASTDTASNATYTQGPFGKSTLTPNSGTQTPMQAINGNQTIANPVNLVFGFTVSNAATPFSLAFTGPITFTSGASRTVTVNTPNQTFTLGSASSPSTLTLNPTAANNLAFDTSQNSTLVINDVIQNSSSSVNNVISFNPIGNNTPQGTVLITGANTFSGGVTFNNQTGGTLAAVSVEIGVSTVGNPGSVTSGPFGTGTITFNASSVPPILQPFGADRTIANALTLTSGFFAANPSSAQDPTGAHNLTFTGPIADPGRVVTNNMAAGVALTLGSAATPSTLTLTGAATIQSQVSGSGGVTVINDLISGGANFITIKGGGTVYFNNPSNAYTGGTAVIGSGSLGSGATLAGTGAVGSGGTLTISSTIVGSPGGIISPGNGSGPGTISVPSMTLDPLGRYVFQYNGTNTTTGSGVNSLISGSGTLSVTSLAPGAAFDINLVPTTIAASATPLVYTIATFSGGIGASGDITSDFTFSGSYNNATAPDVQVIGNSLVLTFTPAAATPEPGGILLFAVAGLFALRRTRRAGLDG